MVSGYRLVSANDAPERDPKSWRLVVDGTAVEEKTGVYFSARNQAKTFQLASPALGQTYRLDVLDLRDTWAANSVQLADLVLLCGVPRPNPPHTRTLQPTPPPPLPSTRPPPPQTLQPTPHPKC